jgi:hypothetical protein
MLQHTARRVKGKMKIRCCFDEDKQRPYYLALVRT